MGGGASSQETGEAKILATYHCDEGTRQLIAQRVRGKVALSDVPGGDEGRVYLVARHVPALAELDGLVADYLALAAELGRPPMQSDWIFEGRI